MSKLVLNITWINQLLLSDVTNTLKEDIDIERPLRCEDRAKYLESAATCNLKGLASIPENNSNLSWLWSSCGEGSCKHKHVEDTDGFNSGFEFRGLLREATTGLCKEWERKDVNGILVATVSNIHGARSLSVYIYIYLCIYIYTYKVIEN